MPCIERSVPGQARARASRSGYSGGTIRECIAKKGNRVVLCRRFLIDYARRMDRRRMSKHQCPALELSRISGHPRWFSWAWTRRRRTIASIQVESGRDQVTLKYRSRSYGEEWSDVRQTVPLKWTPCRFGGERPWFICSVYSNGRYCGRNVTKLYGAGKLFPAASATALPMPANKNPPINAASTAHKRFLSLGRKREHV